MNKDIITIVHNYWSKKEFGKKMITSNNVSDSDLLFLIPNNKKKMLGLPLTRVSQKHKKNEYKIKKRENIYHFKFYDLIEEVVTDLLGNDFANKSFQQFVDYKNLEIGDKNVWH